jgi:hypothetical protein
MQVSTHFAKNYKKILKWSRHLVRVGKCSHAQWLQNKLLSLKMITNKSANVQTVSENTIDITRLIALSKWHSEIY